MRVKYIPLFQVWLLTMMDMDRRLNGGDFNLLYKIFLNSCINKG